MIKRRYEYVPITIHRPDPFTTCQYETRYVWVGRDYYEPDEKTDLYGGGGGGGEGDASEGGIVLLLGGIGLIIYFIIQGDFFNQKPATSQTWQTFGSAVSFCYRHSLYIFLISLKFAIWDMNVMVWKSIMHVAAYAHDLIMNSSRGSAPAFNLIGAFAFGLYLLGTILGIVLGVAYAVKKYARACVFGVATILFGFLIFPGLAGLSGWLGVLAYQSW